MILTFCGKIMAVVMGLTEEQRREYLRTVPVVCFMDRLGTKKDVLANSFGQIRASHDVIDAWKFLADVCKVRPEIKVFGGSDCIWVWGYGIENVIEVSATLFQQLHFVYNSRFRAGIAQGNVEIGAQWLEELEQEKKLHTLNNFHPPHILVGDGGTQAAIAEGAGRGSQIFLHPSLDDILRITPHPNIENSIAKAISVDASAIRWTNVETSAVLYGDLARLRDRRYRPFNRGLTKHYFGLQQAALAEELAKAKPDDKEIEYLSIMVKMGQTYEDIPRS